MVKLKIGLLAALIIIALLAASFFLPGIWGRFNSNKAPVVSIHTAARQVLPVAEFVSLRSKYTDVFEESEEKLKNIYGLSIPGTGKRVIIKAQGTVFLGIDCKDIKIDTNRSDALFITFPPIKIIAHDFEFTEVIDLSGIFRRQNIKNIPELRNNYRLNVESNVMRDRDVISLAADTAESAFKEILLAIPALKDTPIYFRREIPVGLMMEFPVELKRDIPINFDWKASEK